MGSLSDIQRRTMEEETKDRWTDGQGSLLRTPSGKPGVQNGACHDHYQLCRHFAIKSLLQTFALDHVLSLTRALWLPQARQQHE